MTHVAGNALCKTRLALTRSFIWARSLASLDGMAGPAIKKYGGKVLARGPVADRLEGDVSGIVMMIEFESKVAANTFYHSEEYQAAKAVREQCSDTDLMIAEGVSD